MLAFKFSALSKFVGFLTVATVSACSPSGNSTDPSVRNGEQDLIGKTGKITYDKFTAEVNYLDDSTIHWKTVDAKGVIAQESEHVSYQKLNDHLYFLNWMEESGLTVSQVIDTQDMKVTAYLTYKDAAVPSGRKTEFLHGKFEYIANH
jgi:hypothetical protein